MRKLFLSMCAFALATVAMAQENFALNKEAKASSVSAENSAFVAANAVDGNKDTKWASDYTSSGLTDDEKSAQWFYVDLGGVKTVNTVKIHTDNQAAKEFEIRLATNIEENNEKASGEAVSVNGTTTLSAVDNSENVYKFDATEARYVIINFKKRGAYGYGICELEVYNIDYDKHVLASVSSSVSFVVVGESTPVTFTAKDENNIEIEGDVKYSVENGTFENGVLTATANGPVTISATYDNVTKKCIVYAVSAEGIPTPDDDIATWIYPNTETAPTWQTAYNGGAKQEQEIKLGNTVVMPFAKTACVFFGTGGWDGLNIDPVDKGYSSLCIDVCVTENCTMGLNINDGVAVKTQELIPGWNTLKINLDAVETIKNMSLRSENNDTKHDVLVTNIYFAKGEIKRYNFVINEQTDCINKITGEVKTDEDAAKLAEILGDKTKVAFDLTKLVLPNTTTSLTVANPNAFIIVNKDTKEATGVKASQLKGQRNLFVYIDGPYISPVEGTKFLITDGYPVFTNRFISTGKNGYEYTRTLTAGKYVTTFLPAETTLPEGVYAYTFESQTEGTYKFKKNEGKLAANMPYILYVEKDATLKCEGTEDLYFTAEKEANVEVEDLVFHGTYHFINGDGTQYALQNNTDAEQIVLKKFVDGSTIGAFRAYFTLNSADAKDIKFVFDNGTVDGITNVTAEASAKAACVYSIDGRLVNTTGVTENLKSGLYIVNGKKVLVK